MLLSSSFKTVLKAGLQIIVAGAVLLAIVLAVRSPQDSAHPPSGIKSFAKFVRKCVPPERLQEWASNVVAQADQPTNTAPIDVEVPLDLKWRIPPPSLPWKARILKPSGINGPSIVELFSFSPAASCGLLLDRSGL